MSDGAMLFPYSADRPYSREVVAASSVCHEIVTAESVASVSVIDRICGAIVSGQAAVVKTWSVESASFPASSEERTRK